MIIRNDDVAADTTLDELQSFCELCDHYSVDIVHAITPIGDVRRVDARMNNTEIVMVSGSRHFEDNLPVVKYLKSRYDQFAVHGLWHTHEPPRHQIETARMILSDNGIEPRYFVPPFNEGVYPAEICGLKLFQRMPRLEEFLDKGNPGSETVYLHSWRFQYGPFSWGQLEACLSRLTRS